MKDILITKALNEEFPFEGYNSITTGVGKVNATLNLYSYLIKNVNIKLVINVGTAGGVNCIKNEVIECGIFEDGQLEYPGFEGEIIEFNIVKNKILTFDNFIFDKPKKYCNCVDMESFALAKVCKSLNVEFRCFKYISDIVGEENQDSEWLENVSNGRYLLKNKVEDLLESRLTSK